VGGTSDIVSAKLLRSERGRAASLEATYTGPEGERKYNGLPNSDRGGRSTGGMMCHGILDGCCNPRRCASGVGKLGSAKPSDLG